MRIACVALLSVLGVAAGFDRIESSYVASGCDPTDPAAFGREIRETLRREYTAPPQFTYTETRRDIDISALGKVSVGPLRTFEVYPKLFAPDYKRLIAIEGKPLDAAELARRDAEHQRNVKRQQERERTESPERRAAREKKFADEQREVQDIFDDATAVFELKMAGRETIGGEPVVAMEVTPRPDARVKTREGGWLKKLQGRMWVSEQGCHIARLRLHAMDSLSIGWGVVARVESGSGFEYTRKKIGDRWVPLEMMMEGSGRTLLFRQFQVRTVTTYTDHRRYAQTDEPGR